MLRSVFEDPFKGRRGSYFLTMQHLDTLLLFRDDEEFAYGVNSLAVCKVLHPVDILCYCLMSNHFHLVLEGTLQECLGYYDGVILRWAKWLKKKRGLSGVLNMNDVDIQAITSLTQFKNVIAYTLRNAYRARVASPFSYRWSSADAYFRIHADKGTPLSALQVKTRRKFLGTLIQMPENYEICDGVIMNQSFVNYRRVEHIFGDSVTFFDTLRIYDIETSVKLASGYAETIRFTDKQLQEKIHTICQKEYHVDSLNQLDSKELLLLAKTLARRFSAGKKQIARLLGLETEVLDNFL